MPDSANTATTLLQETLGSHRFCYSTEGDGWSERLMESYDCSCGKSHYGLWVQEDPERTGRRELHEDIDMFHEAHDAHLARVLAPVLEAAWDAGHDSGTRQASRPTRIDLAGDHNPFRVRGPEPEAREAVRYPRAAS